MEAWPINSLKVAPISRKLEITQNEKTCSKQRKLLEIRKVHKTLPSNLWQTLAIPEAAERFETWGRGGGGLIVHKVKHIPLLVFSKMSFVLFVCTYKLLCNVYSVLACMFLLLLFFTAHSRRSILISNYIHTYWQNV